MEPLNSLDPFEVYPSLLDTSPYPACRASVIIPSRNEEHALPAALDALRLQVDARCAVLDFQTYEVIVLLNNGTDDSAALLRRYQRQYPGFHLHFVERFLPPEIAHVGTARRMLMDTAYRRVLRSAHPDAAILSTDADTIVAPDWIDRNLDAIQQGAEVVGGVIHLKRADLASLDAGTLAAYAANRRYQQLIARLESLLDPDAADPWPRHLEHFGASLACTPVAYRRSGGLPPVAQLEDVAFIDALRRADARIRHAPDVCVYTSARLDGRAEVGLSSQLRRWQQAANGGKPCIAETAAWLIHRFSSLAQLRHLGSVNCLPPLTPYPLCWHQPLLDHHPRRLTPSAFLCAIDCDRLINETFHGQRQDTISRTIAHLEHAIAKLTRSQIFPGEVFDAFPSFSQPKSSRRYQALSMPEQLAQLVP